ncbi:MAG TPA: hypothetical protein VF596_00615 [Pyrinomonadaceae bacterium]|jgi:antitoxin component of MazEF toxin-antitoxin module
MPEVLEIMQTETEENKTIQPKWDSWVVEIPKEIIEAQGLADDSSVVLTVKDGKIEAEVLTPLSDELKTIAEKILKKRRKVFEELKRIGD